MGKILILMMIFVSVNGFSASYNCPKLGAKLIENGEYRYVLKNSAFELDCEIGFTNFPGTEVDMKLLRCFEGESLKKEYYFTQVDENKIWLTKDLILARSKTFDCIKE